MKRFYIAAVAGLCAVAPVRAQQGGVLAPTVPVVPSPALHNGSLVAPGGAEPWGGTGSRLFGRGTWSPIRSPVGAGDPVYTGYATPPLPAGIGGAPCDSAGGAPARGMCWERLKAWLCFHPTKTELPKLRPAPYVQPLQGMFGCTSGAGCVTCAGGAAPAAPQPLLVPAPMAAPAGSAGAVRMPPRGPQGYAVPTVWQNQTAAAPTSVGVTGARFATPDTRTGQKPAQGPVVTTGYRTAPK